MLELHEGLDFRFIEIGEPEAGSGRVTVQAADEEVERLLLDGMTDVILRLRDGTELRGLSGVRNLGGLQ